jgi:phosphoribosylpyrophosphate synthetase
VHEADRYAQVAAERRREQQAMLGYLAAGGCRMEYLRRELDDSGAAPCGRCDNCTGRHWQAGVSQSVAEAARERLTRPGVQVEPRKMWPAGMPDLGIAASGRIGANLVLPEPLAESVAQLTGPVLLVDDRIETGWTMTVAAKLLREAGAPAVLPFALAVSA